MFLFCWVLGLKDELEKISRLFQYYKFNRILIMYDKNENKNLKSEWAVLMLFSATVNYSENIDLSSEHKIT